MNSLFEFLLIGLGAGGIYTLVALSIVVVYRGSGIINFAAGGTAFLGAALYYELGQLMPVPLAVVVAVLACALFGALIQFALMQRMRNAAPIVKVVATLGVMTVLSSAGALRYGNTNFILVQPVLPHDSVHIFGVAIGMDRLICFGFGLLLAVLLTIVYKKTNFGRATTGVSENERAVAALGWSPGKIALVNWSAGSAMAGLAGILFAPIVGFSTGPIVLIILPALSAALFGNFLSFPVVFCGAALVGMLESLSTKYVSIPGWTQAVPFLVIVVVLVVRGRALPLRGHIFDRLPTVGTARIRPVQAIVGFGLVAISLAAFTNDWAVAVATTMVFSILCLSLVVVTGYGGQLSLAQFALAGIGALTSSRLADVWNVPFIPALLAGVVVATCTGVVVALPALRVRGANLAVVTLGLAEVITSAVLGNPAYTGGINRGTVVPNPHVFGVDVASSEHPRLYALVALALLGICMFVVANIRRSRTGRRLLAVRSNERAAMSLGISVTGAKLYAFAVSAALAAVAGALLAFQYPNVDFTQFSVISSIQVVLYAVIGGIGYVGGALQGGVLAPSGVMQEILAHWVSVDSASFALVGAILLLPVIVYNKDGIAADLASKSALMRNAVRSRMLRMFPQLGRCARGTRSLAARRLAESPVRVNPMQLEVKGLSVSYGGTKAVDALSLVVKPGQVVGMIGANGAGKTSLIDAISGLTASNAGEIWLGGQRIDAFPARKRARAGLGRSFQSLELFDDLTVEENIRTATDARDVTSYFKDLAWPGSSDVPPLAQAVITAFKLERWLANFPSELPYAQRKLVGIARAVAAGPSILMLDEPASGLDAGSTVELAEVVRSLAAEWGMGVLLVEHDVGMVLEVSDHVYAVDFGQLIGHGSPAEIRVDPRVIAAYIGNADSSEDGAHRVDEPQPAAAQAVDDPVLTARSGASAGVASKKAMSRAIPNGSSAWRVSDSPRMDENSTVGPPLLSLSRVHSGYGPISVIRDVDLRVERGEVVALLGANGAGKTTTLLTIGGVLRPTSGSITSLGAELSAGLDKRARAGIGMVFEERGIIPSLTTADNLKLVPGGVDAAVSLFPELGGLLKRRAALLSGGEQQMLTVARALAAEPDLLLIDELSLGLAPMVVERILLSIRNEVEKRKIGVLLVEQRIHTALRFCDRAAVLRRGEIVLEDDAASLRDRADEITDTYLAARSV